jgi:hypothetical protein
LNLTAATELGLLIPRELDNGVNGAMSVHGTHATFHDAGRKADISPKPDIAGHLSMLVYEFTP